MAGRAVEGHVTQMLSKASALEDWTTFLSDVFAHCVLSVRCPWGRYRHI